MKLIHTLFMACLALVLLPSILRADEDSTDSTPGRPPITTHWTTLGGMQYLQNDKILSGGELKTVIDSLDDQQASELLRKSETEETLGFMGIGGSLVLSIVSLFFPNTHIYVVGLDISTPYLPLAIPGTVIGVAGALLASESGTAKYASVQRYNRLTKQPESVTWNLSPQPDGLTLGLSYHF